VCPTTVVRIGAGKHTLIHEILRHGLVARDLGELVITEDVEPAVTHLQQIGARPHTEPDRERRRHAAPAAVLLRLLDDARVALHGRFVEGIQERLLVGRVSCVVGAHALAHILGHRFDGEATRLLTRLPTPHSIGDHGEVRERLVDQGELSALGEAGAVDLHVPPQRADHEVILVVLPHLPGMREAVGIDVLVEGPAPQRADGGGGVSP
jgi:hypothetical protein